MSSKRRATVLAYVVATALAMSACGGDDDSASESSVQATSGSAATSGTETPSDTASAAPGDTASTSEPSGTEPTGGPAAPTAQLTIGISTGPGSLDPAHDGAGETTLVHSLASASIIRLDPADGSLTGDLAETFGFVDDEFKVFEFTLRDGAKFSDGTPVDAAAVVAWLEYFQAAGGPFAGSMGTIQSIEAVDGLTVRLTVENPNPTVPLLLSRFRNWGMIQSSTALADPEQFGTATFGAGPYVLDGARTVSGDTYTFVPNEHYYAPEDIRYAEVVVKVISDPSSMLQAIATGQLDYATGSPLTAAAAMDAGLTVDSHPSGYNGLTILDAGGTIVEALGDTRVRQALNYAIDRVGIADALYGEYAMPSAQAPSLDPFPLELTDHYAFDPDMARQLLTEAGFGDGLTLPVVAYGEPEFVQAMAADLADVGVELDITTASNIGELIQLVVGGQHPIIVFAQGATTMWDFYNSNIGPGGILNPFGASDSEMDALFQEANALPAEDALAVWQELSERHVTEAWDAVVVATHAISYYGDEVGGFAASAAGFVVDPTLWSPVDG